MAFFGLYIGVTNYLLTGMILQVSIFLAIKPLGGSSHLGYVVSEGGKPSRLQLD